MEKTEKRCPYCSATSDEGGEIVCPVGTTSRYKDGRENNNKSISSECTQPNSTVRAGESGVRCLNCGNILTDDQAFCPKCGQPRPQKRYCTKCGNALIAEQTFCPKCGQPASVVSSAQNMAGTPYSTANVVASTLPAGKKKHTKVILSIIAAIVGIILLVFFVGSQVKQKRIDILHEELQESLLWQPDFDSEVGAILYLDFSKDKIRYYGDFGILSNLEIATMDYEVTSGNTITVYSYSTDYGKVTQVAQVDIDGDTIIFTPSLVNTEEISIWFRD